MNKNEHYSYQRTEVDPSESWMDEPEVDDEVLSYSPHTLKAMHAGDYDEFYAQPEVEFEVSDDELDSLAHTR